MTSIPEQSQRPTFLRTILPLSLGIALWAGTLTGACVSSSTQGRSVTPVYHAAVEDWFAGRSLYSGGGMHYFPQFVFLFALFHFLPTPYGDILWRVLSASLLAWTLWQLLRLLNSRWTAVMYALASLLALRSCFSAMRNGQANVAFAAVAALAAVCLARARWRSASLWLLVSVVLKPIGLVLIFFAAPVYRKLCFRLAVGLSVLALLPFFLGHPSYVIAQYGQSVRHLFSLSATTENRFADINGLLRALGVGINGRASQIVRTVAGLFTAAFWWWRARGKDEPDRAIFFLALVTTFLMLFNPMTEENGYIIVAPVIAVYAVRFLFVDHRPTLGWILACVSLLLSAVPDIYGRLYPTIGLWWHPLMILVFAAALGLFASQQTSSCAGPNPFVERA